jgi:hypothetical protein
MIAALLLGCGDSDPSGPDPNTLVLAFNAADPAGDTIAPPETTLPRALDLLAIRGDFKRDSLIITLTFSSPVAPATASAANSLLGILEMDIDDNPTTGEQPISNFFGANANLGIEYGLLFNEGTSTSLDLVTPAGSQSAVIAAFSGNTVTARIPTNLLGNDDRNFGVVGVFGTEDRPTDFAPNSGAITVRVASALSAVASSITATPGPARRAAGSWSELTRQLRR